MADDQPRREAVEQVPDLPGRAAADLVNEVGVGFTLRVKRGHELSGAEKHVLAKHLEQQVARCRTFCGFESGCNDQCLASVVRRELETDPDKD